MAEALLRRRLVGRSVGVDSAGLLPGGAAATDLAVATLAADGLDIAGHRSRQVSPYLLDEADLIIGMTRQHVIELTVMAPDAWPRIFQLVDLVRRAEAVGRRRPDQPLAEWLAAVGEGRTRSGLLAASLNDDIADPVGQSAAVYERTKKQLDDLVSRLAVLL
jgi:protein-tyrosine phosphatase